MSRLKCVLASSLLCLGLCYGTAWSEEKPQPVELPSNWKFSLPEGNAADGKEAFRRMQCYSCHQVPGSDLPEARTSGGVGPNLTSAYSKLPREFLAESVIGSHKYISGTLEKYTGLDKVSSKMGDYSSIMSVRDLLDIVEFLKHLNHAASPPAK